MRALWRELVVVAVALLAVAGAVHGLRDGAVLVSPPEAVVEEFVEKLAHHRWGPARAHLAEELAPRRPADSLRAFAGRIERRVGRIEEVRGAPYYRVGDAAESVAELRTPEGPATLRFPLVRERGVWKVSRLDPILALGR